MTSSKSASRRRRRDREPRTLPAPAYDATAIEFTGASGTGLPDPDGAQIAAIRDAGYRAWDTRPPAGYTATTGPMPTLDRPAVTIGDALTRDNQWGPKLAPLPCGHCGAPPPVPAGILERTRIIGHVNWLALQDGWKFDYDLTWTCPPCQQGDAWKARQGQLEVRLDGPPDAKVPPAGTCDRHDLGPDLGVPVNGYRCTCPGAVLAVDVMLASEDHLGSGRGRHRTVTR